MIHSSRTQQTMLLGLFLIASSLITAPLLHAQTGGCTKTVSKGGGADFTSIQAGIDGIASGQTLCVKGGNWKYEEAITLNKANITVKAHPDTPAPVLDGKYNRNLISGSGTSISVPFGADPGYLPGYTRGTDKKGKPTLNAKSMVAISKPNVTFDGFVIQNIAGRGIGISASDVTVSNNKLYWIHNSAISSNTTEGVKNIVVKNNVALFASLLNLDEKYKTYIDNAPDPSTGIVKFGNIRGDMLLQGNYLAYGHGEGINIGKNTIGTQNDPIIIEKNVIHDSSHKIINTNSARYVHVRNNLAFSPNPMIKLDGVNAGGPFEILDEATGVDKNGKPKPWVQSNDIYFYNNIVVNTETNCFRIGSRYSTYKNIYIGFNTFITGPNTTNSCIKPQIPYEKINGIFENNLIYSPYGLAYQGSAGNLTFRNNIWYPSEKAPTGGMFGSGSLKVDPKLVDPNSQIKALKFPGETKGTFLNYSDLEFLPNGFQVDIDANKYRINSGSPAINAASQRTAVNGFMPPQEAYATDYFGRARGTNPDIGAHESDGTAIPTPTTGPSPTQEPAPDDWDLDNDSDVDVFDFNRYIKKVMTNQDSWTKLASFIAAFRLGE